MTNPRDLVAKYLLISLPDDITLLWDNIAPPPRVVDEPYIRVSIRETYGGAKHTKYIAGDARLDIAVPYGTAMTETDRTILIIRKRICFRAVGYLTFLDRHIGQTEVIGAYHITPVTVPYLYFDGLVYG